MSITNQCECHRCIKENDLKDPHIGKFPLSMTKMILCPTCGNKRCPKASDHRLECTGSNEPGQPGSIYSHVPQTGCAKINSCRNRFEVIADWGMDSETMAEWAHAALDRWLKERVDLSTGAGHNSGNPAQQR